MAKTGKIIIAIFILGGIFVFPAASQQPWTRADLQSIYLEYLRQEGYPPIVDKDQDIEFKVAGETYYIIVDENDLKFFQIYRGFRLPQNISQETALNAAIYSNRNSKVAKVTFSPDGNVVSITVELLLNDPNDFIPVFSRAISLIRNAENNFITQIR
jgi:hypothetical protein